MQAAARRHAATIIAPVMAGGSLARFVAPLALVVAALAVVAVVATSAGNGDGGSTATTTASKTTTATKPPKPQPKTYTVKEGDNLSIIAEKTGVTVEELQALNPDLDPQALTVGQKITIRE